MSSSRQAVLTFNVKLQPISIPFQRNFRADLAYHDFCYVDSDSEEEEEEISSFYTPNQHNNFPLRGRRALVKGQSEVTFNMVINKGICSFYTPFTVSFAPP
jgi:hypothetical protein